MFALVMRDKSAGFTEDWLCAAWQILYRTCTYTGFDTVTLAYLWNTLVLSYQHTPIESYVDGTNELEFGITKGGVKIPIFVLN